MPPKGRKSFSASWYACETCGVFLAHKDIQLHNNSSCPPDITNWEYAYIKDNILSSFIEFSSIKDNPKVNDQDKMVFLFMSQSAMQLCHFEIGEQVLLRKAHNEVIVRTVWPTTERTLTSVIIPLPEAVTSKTFIEEGSRIKVQKLTSKPIPAVLVNLTCSLENDINISELLLVSCKRLYTGKILKCGSEILVPFYGKTLSLAVKSIKAACKEDCLADELENLNVLNKLETEETFYLVVESSKWELEQNTKLKKSELIIKEINIHDIGGYKELVQELLRSVMLTLKINNVVSCMSSSLGILLHGPNGVGKTFITQAVANEMNVHVVKISSGELFSKFYGETELRLRNLFAEAREKSPSIIILDNIDTLCPKRGGTEQERRVIAYLLTLLDSLKEFKVVVLATTSHLNLIDSSLRRPGRLDTEIEIPIPSIPDRFDILKVLLKNRSVEDTDMKKLACAAHGYVAADLHCLVSKAVMQALSENKTDIDISNLFWALSQISPSAMREVLVQVPNVKWTDIGGMDELKLKLKQTIEWPLYHPEAFIRLGINPPRGVLMYGPPGCSKTMIAKALATESKLNFLSIKGSDLFSKWVGESEKAVQSLFKKARAVAPSIVFLDELDALGGERSNSSEGTNVQERVLAQLLTEIDGVESLGNVNIVAATNRPDRIDKALLRPGRLDRMIYVPLPDLATRICILQLQLVKMPVARDIEIDDLASMTDGYSGAEIIAVCHEAALSALQEDFGMPEIHERHFFAALDLVKPRTPLSLLKLYDSYSKT